MKFNSLLLIFDQFFINYFDEFVKCMIISDIEYINKNEMEFYNF
jgi:hypothetical protein